MLKRFYITFALDGYYQKTTGLLYNTSTLSTTGYTLSLIHISLSIENDIRVGFVNFCDDLVDRLGVDQSDKVKTETVDVVFICPIFDRVYNILSHHGTLGGSVISTVGALSLIHI